MATQTMTAERPMHPDPASEVGPRHEPDLICPAADLIGQEILGGTLDLPVLPNVAAAVLASSVSEDSDAARLATLIQQDQSLASHVLRIANSPAFRAAQVIVSLQQAIARLGMTRIREIAISISLRGAVFRHTPYRGIVDELWHASLATALWARAAARATRKSAEVAYLCGLLLQVGAPVVLNRLGELDPELDRPTVQAALDRLAVPAGIALARAWSLPEAVQATLIHVRDPRNAGAHADLVAAAGLGAALAAQSLDGVVAAEPLLELPATIQLNLYPEDIDALLRLADEVQRGIASMLV